jgi:hypothetical protein
MLGCLVSRKDGQAPRKQKRLSKVERLNGGELAERCFTGRLYDAVEIITRRQLQYCSDPKAILQRINGLSFADKCRMSSSTTVAAIEASPPKMPASAIPALLTPSVAICVLRDREYSHHCGQEKCDIQG